MNTTAIKKELGQPQRAYVSQNEDLVLLRLHSNYNFESAFREPLAIWEKRWFYNALLDWITFIYNSTCLSVPAVSLWISLERWAVALLQTVTFYKLAVAVLVFCAAGKPLIWNQLIYVTL